MVVPKPQLGDSITYIYDSTPKPIFIFLHSQHLSDET